MNRAVLEIVRAVAEGKVTTATMQLARRLLERESAPAPAKRAIASLEHHRKTLRAEEGTREDVKEATWAAVLHRSMQDHRMRQCCEACHRETWLEPHHLEMGSGNRRDAPEVVMALCAECHRLGQRAAHVAIRWFALSVVIPWARAHGYPLPNRKEYRDA